MNSFSDPSPELLLPTSTANPRGMSIGGFILPGQSLEAIRQVDDQAMKIMGYTHIEIAGLLTCLSLPSVGQRFDGCLAKNGRKYEYFADTHPGSQDCPWEGASYEGNVDYSVLPASILNGFPLSAHLNRRSIEIFGDDVLYIPGMLQHLIREHSFFEGGPYRVAPETIVEWFGTERITGSFDLVRELRSRYTNVCVPISQAVMGDQQKYFRGVKLDKGRVREGDIRKRTLDEFPFLKKYLDDK